MLPVYTLNLLRPYGDIDLRVHPDDFARTIKRCWREPTGWLDGVDLHRGFLTFDNESWGGVVFAFGVVGNHWR